MHSVDVESLEIVRPRSMGVELVGLWAMGRLYRASDALTSRRRAIEDHLFAKVSDLLGLRCTITLIDLTNTFFEGAVAKQPKEQCHDTQQ